ncbi:MAG TPA: pyridoxal-phosphate dependent enzyme [Woeseiaceae bacterium]|nr:pyridoxal-phosphate dependent enzyme [Woeseiaceae bacterium]
MSDSLRKAYPRLADRLEKLPIATLPTPVSCHELETQRGIRRLLVKRDDLTSDLYGGNKIRKLEYIFRRAKDRGAERVATFGAVGSNHALATAMHARQLGFECSCFLAHQVRTPRIRQTLDMHLELGTELIKWGGAVDHLELYRRTLQGRNTWVIPLGGTCWLGALGFVNAGLELAQQITNGELDAPNRIYMANGTMGSVAGLAIGLDLAGLAIEIQAVRVADNRFTRREVLERLIRKTAVLLNTMDPSIPADAGSNTPIVWRSDFFAGAYAAVDDITEHAVDFASHALNLRLETTYTGKAMAALLHDLNTSDSDARYLFWNTHNSRPLPTFGEGHPQRDRLPEQFARYYD